MFMYYVMFIDKLHVLTTYIRVSNLDTVVCSP